MIQRIFSANMLYALAAMGLAFVLAYYSTPLARRLAIRCECFDIPDGKRKCHAAPIPYFGGLAIFAGFAIPFLLFAFFLTGTLPNEIFVIFIGGLSICLAGLFDDIYGMAPKLKLLLQIIISAFTAHFGFVIEYITLFGFTIRFGMFAEVVTVIWLVCVINAVNLIDGLNGLAGGISVLESFALLITALLMGNPVCAAASAALCGAVLGFLPFNFGKASIFMGDAGSMTIGYIMACISVLGLFKAQALFSILVPAMIFALPVMDALNAFFRRIMHGQSPFTADHKHLHHVLVENGFSPMQSVLVLLGAVGLFCISSVIYIHYQAISLILFLSGMILLLILKHNKRIFSRLKKQNIPPVHRTGESISTK